MELSENPGLPKCRITGEASLPGNGPGPRSVGPHEEVDPLPRAITKTGMLGFFEKPCSGLPFNQ
jgi:hypothetical protein